MEVCPKRASGGFESDVMITGSASVYVGSRGGMDVCLDLDFFLPATVREVLCRIMGLGGRRRGVLRDASS